MEDLEELKYAWLCVQHPFGSDPKIIKKMKIKRVIYQITLEEELGVMKSLICKRGRRGRMNVKDSSSNASSNKRFTELNDVVSLSSNKCDAKWGQR